jgi:phosphatidylserine/phosphatidylglycerophosphate/cardiolipin synthase-like enzyme
MDWLLLATGFTGGMTFVFGIRWLYRKVIGPLSVESCFSPKGGCTDVILRELKKARRHILVQAYSFSSKPIAEALKEAKMRGVQVEILLDKSNEQEAYSDLPYFQEQGLSPLVDHEHAIAHNKIILIDHSTLLTGSFNFTHQAEAENAENLLVIKGHPDLFDAYHKNFMAHKVHCKAAQAKPHVQAFHGHQKAA